MSASVSTKQAIASVIGVAAAIVTLAGCGLPGLDSDSAPKTSSPSPSFVEKAPVPSAKPLGPDARVPDRPKVDWNNPSEVAQAWAVVAYGYDTKYDSSPHDAVLRAAPYYTKNKAAQEREYHPAAGSGEQWNTWAKHNAWTKAKATLEVDGDSPPDKPKEAHRQLTIVGIAHGRDGWKSKGPRLQAFVKLVRSGEGEPWRISEVNAISEAAVPSAPPSESPD
ncbi:hypothetical protein ABZS71_07525 [Streptomyces sp. NPDC005393]|uniref:hypothetical protein n=1 Tax=Streptomyces sp. NPDC005393 TaxID=3157041 RepID=UPI0033B23885